VREEGEEGEEGGVGRIGQEFYDFIGYTVRAPREWTVLSNVPRVTMSARVTVTSPRGVITKESELSGCSNGGRGRLVGVARISSMYV
jgi:hypothetical protein